MSLFYKTKLRQAPIMGAGLTLHSAWPLANSLWIETQHMDNLLGFIGSILKHFLFDIFSFWFGWTIIKIGTLGRYPRTINPRKPDCADYQLVAAFGLLTFVGIIVFLTYLQN